MSTEVKVKYPTVAFQTVPRGAKFKTSPESDVLFMKTGPGGLVVVNLTAGEEVEDSKFLPSTLVYRADAGPSFVKYGDLKDGDFFLYQGSLYVYLDGGDPDDTTYYKRLGAGAPEVNVENDTPVRRVNVNIEVVY